MLDYIVFRVILAAPESTYSRPVTRDGQLCFLPMPDTFTRTEALALCDSFNERHGGDYQRFELRRADGRGLGWQDRERQRFSMLKYRPTPWHNEAWYQAKHGEHFCHISTEQPGKIAFTENAAKGEADRQLVMKPGRYLTRYFSDVLSNEDIEGWCAKLSVQLQEDALKVTQDADEIEDVYVGGPSSCMSNAASDYQGHCHPARVYAGPDLAIAYLGSREDATARCVVWPEEKRHGRIYGDVSRMKLMLAEAGYTEGGMGGAKFRRIEDQNGNGLIMPYVDNYEVSDEGDHCVLGSSAFGSYVESGSTSGTSVYDSRPCCDRCDECMDDDDMNSVCTCASYYYGEQTWCDYCVSNHAFTCQHDGRTYADYVGYTEITVNGCAETIADHNLSAYGAIDVDGTWYHEDDAFICPETGDGCLHEDAFDWDGETISHAGAEERMRAFDADEHPIAHIIAWRESLHHVRATFGSHPVALALAA